MAGAVCGFKLQKTWVNSKEKQMLTERKIKRGIKISSLKFTSVSSLCYKYEIEFAEIGLSIECNTSLCKNKTECPLDTR